MLAIQRTGPVLLAPAYQTPVVAAGLPGSCEDCKPATAASGASAGDPRAERAGSTAAADRPTDRPAGLPEDPSQRTDGFGPEAQRNLFESRLAEPSGEGGETGGLTDEEQDVVRDLAARDAEVRRHEEAHAAVGGQYAGQPSYTYQTGPDGQRYAVGGEVPIDIAPVKGDPEATIDKMEIVKAAALAPAEPSGADKRIAQIADAQRLAAIAELNARRAAEIAATFDTDPAAAQGRQLDRAA